MSGPVLGYESPGVHAHLGTIQAVIDRMAGSANACKFWCIALISAVILGLGLGRVPDVPLPANYVLLSLLPVTGLLFLNAYYHSQELRFRRAYKEFVESLSRGAAREEHLFRMPDKGDSFCRWLESFSSISIWPFYGMITVVILLAWLVVL